MTRAVPRRRQTGMALMIALFALVVLALMAGAMMAVSTEASRLTGRSSALATANNAAQAGAEAARGLLLNTTVAGLSQASPVRAYLCPSDTAPISCNAQNVVYIVNYANGGAPGQPWATGDPYADPSYVQEADPFNPGSTVASGYSAPLAIDTDQAAPDSGVAMNLNPALKWVRISVASENNAGQVLDPNDPTFAGSWLVYSLAEGRFPAGDTSFVANQSNAQPVYQIVAYADNRGYQRTVVEETTKFLFPFQPPASVFETGDDPVFSHPDSANWGANGQDSTSSTLLPALGGTSATAVSNLISQLKRPGNYLGAGSCEIPPCSPSVVNLNAPPLGVPQLNANYDQVGSVTPQTGLKGLVAQLARIADNKCTAPGGTLSCNGPTPSFTTPQVTVVEGDITLPTTGTGIVVATGTITLPKNIDWTGLIMDIGAGVISGTNGHPTFNGAIFDANICADPDNPSDNLGINENAVPARFSSNFPELGNCTQIGDSDLTIGNGGGNGGMQYDSQAIGGPFASRSYQVLSYRELSGIPY